MKKIIILFLACFLTYKPISADERVLIKTTGYALTMAGLTSATASILLWETAKNNKIAAQKMMQTRFNSLSDNEYNQIRNKTTLQTYLSLAAGAMAFSSIISGLCCLA